MNYATTPVDLLYQQALSVRETQHAALVSGVTSQDVQVDDASLVRLLSRPDLTQQVLQLVPLREVARLLPELPNSVRLKVLDISTRAVVMNGLAKCGDMSAEVFDAFITHGTLRALREFLSTQEGRGRQTTYTPDQVYTVWETQVSRFKEVPRGIPHCWEVSHISQAFDMLTSRLRTVRGYHPMTLPMFWAGAEIVGVVTEAQRQSWSSAFPDYGIGPLEFHVKYNNVHPEVEQGWSWSQTFLKSADPRAVYGLTMLGTRDVWNLISTPWPQRAIQLLVSDPKVLAKCTDSALRTCVIAGLISLEVALQYAEDVGQVITQRDQLLLQELPSVDLVQDVIVGLAPATAVAAASHHGGDFDLQSLYQYIADSLGDEHDCWAFFWNSFGEWGGSLEDLVLTAAAI